MAFNGGPGQQYGYDGAGYGHPNYYQQPAPPQPEQQPRAHPQQYHMPGLPQMGGSPYVQQHQYQNQSAYQQQPQYNPNGYASPQQTYYQNTPPQPRQYYPQYADYQQQRQPVTQLQPQTPTQYYSPTQQTQPIPQLQQPVHVQQYSPHVQQLQSPHVQQMQSPHIQQMQMQMPPPQFQPSPRSQPTATPPPKPGPVTHASPLPKPTHVKKETPILPPIRRNSSLQTPVPTTKASPVSRPGSVPKTSSPYISHNQVKKNEQVVDSKLLMALAEEFFSEAHKLGASSVQNLTKNALDTYQKLIATGLGCLETCLLNLDLRPRLQAKIRLKFAAVMYEETENTMEAELALSKGITICEQNKFVDLKYNMQFLLAKILFKSKPKAGLKMLDTSIADAEAYRHKSWVYAFRFLRATLSMSMSGGSMMHAAVDNLRSISTSANERNDRAIFSMSSLLEVILYLSSPGSDSSEHARRALAASWTYQLDETSSVPQIKFLTHSLDVICSFLYGPVGDASNKLRTLQMFMDSSKDDSRWTSNGGAIAVPIARDHAVTQVVSEDTRAVLNIGEDGHDHLMMSFVTLKEAMSLTNLLSGIVLLHKDSVEPHKASMYLRQAHIYLTESKKSRKKEVPLPALLESVRWRITTSTHAHIYQAFCFAIRTQWAEARKHLTEIETAIESVAEMETPLPELLIYLTGLCHQGTGQLDQALDAFQDPRLVLRQDVRVALSASARVRHDLSLLALLNTIWIRQETARQDPNRVTAEIAALEPLCHAHPDVDMRTAFNLIKATVVTSPPSSAIKQKNFISIALQNANGNQNNQFLSMVFTIMYSKFFNGVVGEQAMKSISTATLYAKKSGSTLWQSVAEGLHAKALEVHGRPYEAQQANDAARNLAATAFGDSA